MAMTLEEKLNNLPVQPGCYLHNNAKGEIIYIGKAKSLRNRVRQYFQSARALDYKTQELVARIVDFEFIVTDSEKEALVLESNLIKLHKPRYNVMLKDDKSYPHLKLTLNEEFPRILKTRRVEKDGGMYFGPYLPASNARRALKMVARFFRVATCHERTNLVTVAGFDKAFATECFGTKRQAACGAATFENHFTTAK